ncbi:MAG: hypothetical protein ACXACK_03305 [Candidatus Hodarchaeales archaeon]
MNGKKTSSLLGGIGLITGLLLIMTFQQLQVLIIDESPLQSYPDFLIIIIVFVIYLWSTETLSQFRLSKRDWKHSHSRSYTL